MTDVVLRWAVVVVFYALTATMCGSLATKLRNAKRGLREAVSFQDRMALVGGSAICFFVATGVLGVLLGWGSVLRLSGLLCAGVFSLIGRGGEWRDELKLGRRR